MYNREFFVSLASEGRPMVQVSVLRRWASDVLDIFGDAGYRLRHIESRQLGDIGCGPAPIYDFTFGKS